jgi:WD40 repeat protein
LDTRERLHHFPLPGAAGIRRAWFDRRGASLFVIRGDGAVHTFDLTTGNEKAVAKLLAAPESDGAEWSLAPNCITSDGRFVVAGRVSLRLFSMADGTQLREFIGHSQGVASLALTADNSYLASSSYDGTARVWEVATGRLIQALRPGDRVLSVAFAAGPQRIVTAGTDNRPGGQDNVATLWDVASAKKLGTFIGHADAIQCLDVSADGRWLVAGSGDKTARTWALPIGP